MRRVMSEFRKQDLLKSLDDIDNILTLSLASITFYHDDENIRQLSETWMMHYGRVWFLKDLSAELVDKQKKYKKLGDFKWTITKFLLREPYTILDEYCKINKHSKHFESQEWYQLARILRNFCTHGILNEAYYTNIQFPVKWDDYEIDLEEIQQGKINFEKFDIHLPRKLFDVIREYAENLPDN